MGELSRLPNIGPKLEAQLNQIGIFTLAQFQETGAQKAWLAILAIDDSACYHRLCALAGALAGIPKKELPEQRKKELKAFYQKAKG